MNLKYMKVSLFEISYTKKNFFHYNHIFLDVPVSLNRYVSKYVNGFELILSMK